MDVCKMKFVKNEWFSFILDLNEGAMRIIVGAAAFKYLFVDNNLIVPIVVQMHLVLMFGLWVLTPGYYTRSITISDEE